MQQSLQLTLQPRPSQNTQHLHQIVQMNQLIIYILELSVSQLRPIL